MKAADHQEGAPDRHGASCAPSPRPRRSVFPIIVTVFVSLLLPAAAPLIGMLMLGNLFKESGVVERLSKTAQQRADATSSPSSWASPSARRRTAETFLTAADAEHHRHGSCARLRCGTAGGVLLGKLMYLLTGGKVNPLIGSAGVSAVPMAARVSQKVGQAENPKQLPADARHGPERGRRHRFRGCRGRVPFHVHEINPFDRREMKQWLRYRLPKPYCATRTRARRPPACAPDEMLPVADKLDKVGYYSLECLGRRDL